MRDIRRIFHGTPVIMFGLFCLAGIVAQGQMPALAPLPGTGGLPAPSNPAQFTFLVAGDNRPAHDGCPQPPIPGEIFAAAQSLKPAFILWSGDTIYGKDPGHEKKLREEYAEFLTLAKAAGVPVFNTPGNHEMDDKHDVPDSSMKRHYRKYMGATYGAFSYGNSRFVSLDSENTPPRKDVDKSKSGAPGYITRTQLDLLKQDLDAHKTSAHVFILMHHPVQAFEAKDGLVDASVKALDALFKNYFNVSYVISGHEHLYYNPQGGQSNPTAQPPSRTDPAQPPFYLVTGGGGAPLKKNPTVGFYNYVVFTVNGSSVSARYTVVPAPTVNNCPG